MHRRQFDQTATVSAAFSPFAFNPTTMARDVATPHAEATPAPARPLADRVAQVDPQVLLDALLKSSVTTPLLPSDAAPVEPIAWDEFGDTDLAGTMGGVTLATGYDGHDNPISIGNAIVHPDAGSASARLSDVTDNMVTFQKMPWFVESTSDYAVSVVQVDYLVLIGGLDTGDVKNPIDVRSQELVETRKLRAISHMIGLLDHLSAVLADLDA
jgi:hypothetical protein